MRVSTLVTLGFLPVGILGQDSFEPADFNVTDALLDNGVNVSAIPALSGLAERSTECTIACSSLKLIFGDAQVETQGESAYDAVINYFWSSQQREPKPYCIVKPEKAVGVSTVILVSRLTQCPFAFRSGGHAAFKSASSIDGGITVTFENMKDITLSKDKKIASIEPGNLWYDIYTTLQNDSLAVVGGRVSAIGIGGLTTGGGISFFSNEYGWACDNVASYEVVTASGLIVTASPTSYSDLYWALRGGGNNFGIVTKFNLETFAHGPLMFGGQRVFLTPSFPQALDAFTNLGFNSAKDTKAAQYLAIAVDVASGTQLGVGQLEYADPNPNPPILDEWRAVPAFIDTLQLNTLAYFTQQLNESNPKGFRETYWTASAKLNRQMAEYTVNITFEEFASILDVQGIVPANTLQAITVPQLTQMQKKGGNALGLTPASGPLLIINLSVRWDKVEDDARVLRANANIVRRFNEEAARRNLTENYLYMNYASQYQDVIGSYDQRERLKRIAKKYDPKEVFQRLQPGYFKLDGPPVSTLP